MADFQTIARPYAQAVFKLAREQGRLAEWSEMLQFLGQVAADEQMQTLLASPRFSGQQLEALFLDICGDRLDDAGRNLLRLLAENRRLIALPDMVRQYESLRATEEGTLKARLISAHPVEDKVRADLAQALGKRLQRKVELESEIDESLLGGAVIRAGDLVIDGSVRGRLKRLASSLNR
ncbi:MAG: F0F1 ATP synthase subunit delta [Ectothiorhodospiraceae bacterium]|nr:F0F1 ATP synthase subunit delta [Ectothiorhodospiraceae bacterium]